MSNRGESRLSRRRSNSMSHIPTLRRDSKTRSKSSIRTESAVKKPRNPSLDRKIQRSNSTLGIQGVGLLGATPLSSQRTTLSVPRTTPLGGSAQKFSFGQSSSARKYSAASSSRSPHNVKKERPVGDKKWVSEQFAKVRRYLQEHPSCDVHVLDNLKPPTINTFVYVANILFKDIDPRINITTANYKETILAHLKMLRYPGNISNSLLKTVNTMHTWPQIVNIFSWLVDLLCCIQEEPVELDDGRNKFKQVFNGFFLEKYHLFNTYSSDEKSETSSNYKEICLQCDESFVQRMEEILDFNKQQVDELKAEIEQLNMLQEKHASKLAESISKTAELQSKVDDMKQQIEQFNTEGPLNEKKQEHDLKTLIQREQKASARIVEKTNNIAQLKENIQHQPCTYSEKKKILAEIDDMKYTLQLKKEKFEMCMQIKDQYDYKLTELKRKVETEVYRLNTALMEIVITNPEMKVLKLRDKSFHHKIFRDEIDKFLENKKTLENKIGEDLAKIRLRIDSAQLVRTELNKKVSSLQSTIEELVFSKKELEEKIKSVADDYKLVNEAFEDHKEKLMSALVELKNKEPDLEKSESMVNDLATQKTTAEADFIKAQKNTLKFFVDFYNVTMQAVSDINKIQDNIYAKINAMNEEKYVEAVKLLEEVKVLQRMLTKDFVPSSSA